MSSAPNRQSEVLAAYLGVHALKDLAEVKRLGIPTEIGSSDDAAYAQPDKIAAVFDRLKQGGEQLRRELGWADQRIAAVARAAHNLPMQRVRKSAKQALSDIRERAQAARADILYNQPDIQALPWHVQNGRALALGTIADAHDLHTDESPSIYPTMSGRLTTDVAEHVFSDRAGWLRGMSLREALVEASVRFHGADSSRASSRAEKELADLLEFTSTPVQQGFKDVVAHCFDSLGIRSRKEEVRAEIAKHIANADDGTITMLSIGCGTALPMLEVLRDTVHSGRDAYLILIDQDPIALAAAEQLAKQFGLADHLELHCERLIHDTGTKTRLLDLESILGGRQVDVCEDSGLREYFPNRLYRDLAKQAWGVVRAGGLMTTGNMNIHRPQPEFLHGLMGWPIPVQMRTAKQVAKLHLSVGIPRDCLRIRLTQDHVYTLCVAEKPRDE